MAALNASPLRPRSARVLIVSSWTARSSVGSSWARFTWMLAQSRGLFSSVSTRRAARKCTAAARSCSGSPVCQRITPRNDCVSAHCLGVDSCVNTWRQEVRWAIARSRSGSARTSGSPRATPRLNSALAQSHGCSSSVKTDCAAMNAWMASRCVASTSRPRIML